MLLASDLSSVVTVRTPYEIWRLPPSTKAKIAARVSGGSRNRTVRFWRAQTGQEILTPRGRSSIVRGVTFSPDEKRIASGNKDKTKKVWDISSLDDLQ